MSVDIDSIRAELWAKMKKKKYRDTFVAAHISTTTAAQIQTMRETQQLTQSDLAKRAGMAQARISVMEDPSYDKLTLSTLKRVASALDVALIVRFVPFSELVSWAAELTPEKLFCRNFAQDSLDTPTLVRATASIHSPRQRAASEFIATATTTLGQVVVGVGGGELQTAMVAQ